jgi:hypothetical protein
MADISKRAKKARKTAGKRAQVARKSAGKQAKVARRAAEKSSTRTRAQAAAALAVAIGAAIATAKLLKGRRGDDVAYQPQPDNLPNEPDRPAGTTPMPTASSS